MSHFRETGRIALWNIPIAKTAAHKTFVSVHDPLTLKIEFCRYHKN